MKSKRLFSALFALLLVGIFTLPVSAAKDVKVQRTIQKFWKIKVLSAIQVAIIPGESDKLTIEGLDNEIQNVITKVENGTLILYTKSQFFKTGHSALKVTVQAHSLTRIDGAGAAKIEMLLKNTTNKFKLDLSGSSYFKGTIVTNSCDIELSGVSKAEITGTAIQCEIDLSGASELDAQQFVIENCDIEASGASKGFIQVTKTLEAEASGASKVVYKGNPVTDIEQTSASTITKQ